MSLSSTLAFPSLLPDNFRNWDEKMILEEGMLFLNQKKEKLQSYQSLWDTSISYNEQEKARENFTNAARKLKREIKLLSKKTTSLLFIELEKNPSSQQMQKLLKVALAAYHGLNYFNSVIQATSESALSDKLMEVRQVKPYCRNPVLAKAASYANSIGLICLATVGCSIYHNSPFCTFISSIASITAYTGLSYVRDIRINVVYGLCDTAKNSLAWNRIFGNEPTAVKVGTTKNIFEKALSGENVGDYIHIPNEKRIDDTLKPRRFEHSGSLWGTTWNGSYSILPSS